MSDNEWIKASKSIGGDACIELRKADRGIELRHSRDPNGPTLTLTQVELDDFLDGAKHGDFDELR